MTTPYNAFWPEQAEKQDPKYSVALPPWHTIEAQGILVRNVLKQEEEEGREVPRIGEITPHRRRFGTVPKFIPPADFDVHNIHCFQCLPSIANERDRIAHLVSKLATPAPGETREGLQAIVQSELAHTMYHNALWRRYGRRVYVLDETTYTLLAETPLPDLPASILASPEHAFYLKFPKNVFSFGVWDVHKGHEETQPVEGVMVSIDNIDPDSPKTREIAMLNVGEGENAGDRNIAYISVALGPDALLSDIRFQNAGQSDPMNIMLADVDSPLPQRNSRFANDINVGSYHLGVTIPRVILGFLLYLQSEHPDIEPVHPTPRRSFKDVKSPKQRQQALDNQAEKLRGTTRLPILYVGRHLREQIEKERQQVQELMAQADINSGGTGRSLDHPVWVRGHWKHQPFGEGRLLRRLIWIRPYLKGPDTATSMVVRASKVQQAQAAEARAETVVTPLKKGA